MLGAGRIGGDERQVELRLRLRRELHLGALGRFIEALERLGIAAQVDALVALELVGQPVDDALVEVVSAEVAVATGGADLDDTVADLQHGDVERAPAEVEHQDGLLPLLVHPVGERGGGRLIDDAQHFQPGDLPGVPCRLALGVVEVGGHRDHGLGDALAEVLGGILGELAQHQG